MQDSVILSELVTPMVPPRPVTVPADVLTTESETEYSLPASQPATKRDINAEATEVYSKMLRESGIPDAFWTAHLRKNCERYASDAGKADAYALAKIIAEEGLFERNGHLQYGMMLTGTHGTGKTWLGTALFKELTFKAALDYVTNQNRPSHEGRASGASGRRERVPMVMWTEAFLFDEEVKDAIATGASSLEVKKRYWNASVLMLDDVGSLERGEETAHRSELLHQTLEYRKNRYLPTILTTNLTPRELAERFGERTYERIVELCAAVNMSGANLRMTR